MDNSSCVPPETVLAELPFPSPGVLGCSLYNIPAQEHLGLQWFAGSSVQMPLALNDDGSGSLVFCPRSIAAVQLRLEWWVYNRVSPMMNQYAELLAQQQLHYGGGYNYGGYMGSDSVSGAGGGGGGGGGGGAEASTRGGQNPSSDREEPTAALNSEAEYRRNLISRGALRGGKGRGAKWGGAKPGSKSRGQAQVRKREAGSESGSKATGEEARAVGR